MHPLDPIPYDDRRSKRQLSAIANRQQATIEEQKTEILSLQVDYKRAINKMTEVQEEIPSSLCPKASDVDTQLLAMYLSLFAGIYGEIREGSPIDVNLDGVTSAAVRREGMGIAHAEAIRLVKRFRREILNGCEEAHDNTNNNTETPRDIRQD